MARGPTLTNVPDSKLPQRTFVLDNGAYTIKAGFAPDQFLSNADCLNSCETIPNRIVRSRDKKTYVAAQSNEISQWSEAAFRLPFENGQLVNWEAQKEIWDYSFFDPATASQQTLIQEPAENTLLLTEMPNTIPALQKNTDEIVLEEWGFGGYMRTIGRSLNAYNDLQPLFEESGASNLPLDSPMDCLLVIDSGYSHTTITPCFQGRPIQRAVRRLDFGGKHLTNLLKEVVSVRHFDLHQDYKIVNDLKEDTAFVSINVKADLANTWKGGKEKHVKAIDAMNVDSADSSSILLDYVLPDGVNLTRGYARAHDTSKEALQKRKSGLSINDEIAMTVGNERFMIPEIMFNPADVGSSQPGLVEAVIQSLAKLPPLLQATMCANILVTGGNASIPGFVLRLQNELRARIKSEWPVRVRKLEDPITSTWLGGARLVCKHREWMGLETLQWHFLAFTKGFKKSLYNNTTTRAIEYFHDFETTYFVGPIYPDEVMWKTSESLIRDLQTFPGSY